MVSLNEVMYWLKSDELNHSEKLSLLHSNEIKMSELEEAHVNEIATTIIAVAILRGILKTCGLIKK